MANTIPRADERLPFLIARHGEELARHLLRLVKDEDIAQDLLQETLLRAHSAGGRLMQVNNARAWLYRVATNVFLNHARSKARELKALRRHASEADQATDPAEREREEELIARRVALWRNVEQLPAKQKEAVRLRIGEGLSYEEIGRRMRCSAAAARANVYQGTRKLRGEGR